MSWLKVETETPDKPEIWAMADLLAIDADAVFGKVFRVWRWFDQHTEDGNAAIVTFSLLDRLVALTGFCAAMEKVGWLVKTESGVCLPNFDRHNGQTAKNRANTAVRVAKHKALKGQGNEEGNGDSVTGTLPREEKRREEETPSLFGKPADVAKEIIGYLNEKAQRQFQSVKANVSLISARLGEGATPEQCRAVIDAKVKAWRNDPKMAEYLRPETLFSAKKFASYVGQLGPQAHGGEAWWQQAGFDKEWKATNAGCTEVSAHQWRNGERVEETQ